MTTADMDVRSVPNASRDAPSEGSRFRQDHTLFLALLVVVNVCLDLVALRPEGGGGMTIFWGGILMGQTFLMGLWMAFGGLHPLVRAFLVACITAAGTLTASVSVGPSFGDLKGAFLQLAPIAGTTVFATHALLLPIRLLMNWRIDFNPAYHAASTSWRAQIRLLDGLGLMTAVALPLALARLLEGELVKVAAVFGGSALLSSLPIVYLIVVPRRSDKAWLVAAAVLGLCIVVEYFSFWSAFDGEAAILLPFHLGLVATLLLNLVPLRCLFGLRLFSVTPGAARHEIGTITWHREDADLVLLADAWPTLPEAVRNQIAALASVASAWPHLPESVRRQIIAATHGGQGPVDS